MSQQIRTAWATAQAIVVVTGALVALPASATENAQERRGARDTKQDSRKDAHSAKVDCRQADQKNNAECRQDKRETKQDGRQDSRDVRSGDAPKK